MQDIIWKKASSQNNLMWIEKGGGPEESPQIPGLGE